MADFGWKLALGCAGILENVNERRVLEPHEGLEVSCRDVCLKSCKLVLEPHEGLEVGDLDRAGQDFFVCWSPMRGWKQEDHDRIHQVQPVLGPMRGRKS